MLGEDHSLRKEFPDHVDTIAALNSNDPQFAETLKRYDLLDQEIRKLEMRDSPIADETINELKNQRLGLKDALYQRLINSQH